MSLPILARSPFLGYLNNEVSTIAYHNDPVESKYRHPVSLNTPSIRLVLILSFTATETYSRGGQLNWLGGHFLEGRI